MGIRAITNHTNLMVATQRIERITEHHTEMHYYQDEFIEINIISWSDDESYTAQFCLGKDGITYHSELSRGADYLILGMLENCYV